MPRTAQQKTTALYTDFLTTVRARLPAESVASATTHQTTGVIAAFVERQASELRTALRVLADAGHRRLDNEGLRLTAFAATVEALDVTATLRRAFVLPLDQHRRIFRSTEAARSADRLDLLFADGSVACRPAID